MKKIYLVLVNGNIKVSAIARKNPIIAFILINGVKLLDKKRKGVVEKKIDNAIEQHVIKEKMKNKKYLKKLKRDIWKSRELYLIDPEEYFLFNFEKLQNYERHEFVGNREKELLCTKLNNNDAWKTFMNKNQTYQYFKQYYKRDVIDVRDKNDKAKFVNFCNQHKKIIVKLSNSSQGKNIFFAEINNEKDIDDIFEKTLKLVGNSVAVVEECIEQSNYMKKLHKESINTIRIATFYYENKVEIIQSFLRIGCGSSRVDNAGSGGIVVSVNAETGITQTNGIRENGERIDIHPDTKQKLKEIQIPNWDEALRLIEELSKIIPKQKYVGWDLALTEQGWVMVEGNSWGQFIGNQMTELKGIRSKINKTFYDALKIEEKYR